MLASAAQIALVFIGLCVGVVALATAHAILVPVSMAIIVGLIFGPIADWFEARGVAPALTGLVVVIILVGLMLLAIGLFAVPLSEWVARGPLIWEKIRVQLLDWKEPLQALASVQSQVSAALGGGDALEVSVQDGSQVLSVALLAPSILGDIVLFIVSFYFFIVTRDNVRALVLSLCVTRRMRWRTAHVFRDVESKVSRFLLSVSFLNAGVGAAMTLGALALGMPSPLLLGVLAAILNYIPYVGQAVMIAALLAVGFGTQSDLVAIFLPVGVYLVISIIEGQFVFPHFVGKTMTLNPFLIFLSIIFWIWVWGPAGSLMAVPALIIMQSIVSNIIPHRALVPSRPVRRTASMTDNDVVLANAARAIREQAAERAGEAAIGGAAQPGSDASQPVKRPAAQKAAKASPHKDQNGQRVAAVRRAAAKPPASG